MYTFKLGVLTPVYNMVISFFQKGHSEETLNFPFIDNLKKLACASKRDGLVLVTLRYLVSPCGCLKPWVYAIVNIVRCLDHKTQASKIKEGFIFNS